MGDPVAVGALLIGDASTAGPLIAGNSAFGSLAGGLLLAVAGLASLWLCLKVAKEAGSLLRMQLSGLLVFAGSHSSNGGSGAGTGGASRAPTSGSSLRDYGSRLARAAGKANGELALAGAGGATLAGTARAAGSVGRRGLIGTAASSVRTGAGRVTGPATGALGHTRAGAVASRMARTGTASWIATAPSPQPTPPHRQPGSNSAANATPAGRRNGRQSPSTTAQPPPATAPGAASRSAKQPGGTDRPARKTGPIAAGSDRSQTARRANRAPAAAPPPPSGSTGGEGPTPSAGPTSPTPARRSFSPPPGPPVPPSAGRSAIGGSAPVDKPKQAPANGPGRRWRPNPKRGGR